MLETTRYLLLFILFYSGITRYLLLKDLVQFVILLVDPSIKKPTTFLLYEKIYTQRQIFTEMVLYFHWWRMTKSSCFCQLMHVLCNIVTLLISLGTKSYSYLVLEGPGGSGNSCQCLNSTWSCKRAYEWGSTSFDE